MSEKISEGAQGAAGETPATTYRIYRVWVPYMKPEPIVEWAEVKVTAKQARIVRASDRGAWRFATVVKGEGHARSEVEAWDAFAADLRKLIRGAEEAIARNRELLARSEEAASAARAAASAPSETKT